MTRRPLRSLAAAVLVTAAAGLTVLSTAPPAAAAMCSTGAGVSVVVDFKQLGEGIQGTCVAGGGGQRASALFPSAGFPISYVQNEPGFVCRVSGLPTADDEPCVDAPPVTAYWGLWWSDGKTGTWTYSSYGVGTLKIPDGGYVALAWKQGDSPAAPPGVAPATHPSATPTPTPSPTPSPSPSPTKSPTSQPTKTPTSNPTGSATTTAPSVSESASVSDAASESESAGATESASPTESAGATETPSASELTSSPPVVQEPSDPVDTESATDDGGGVPIGIVLVLILSLFAASAGAVVLRRRQAP